MLRSAVNYFSRQHAPLRERIIGRAVRHAILACATLALIHVGFVIFLARSRYFCVAIETEAIIRSRPATELTRYEHTAR